MAAMPADIAPLIDYVCKPREAYGTPLQLHAIRPGFEPVLSTLLEIAPFNVLWDTPFLDPWAGARSVIEYIGQHPEEFEGRRVIDIGAGSGLAGIMAARAGAAVTAVDRDPLAATMIKKNAELNGACVDVITGDLFAHDAEIAANDIVLACDVVFHTKGKEKTHWIMNAARDRQVLLASCDFDFLNCDLPQAQVFSTPGRDTKASFFSSMALMGLPEHAAAFFCDRLDATCWPPSRPALSGYGGPAAVAAPRP
jgi:SAM-dependent methyltransferase